MNGDIPEMKRNYSIFIFVASAVLTIALIAGHYSASAQGKTPSKAPKFEVDPLWPKPLPNHWVLGSVTGVAVDAQDHIWIVHKGASSLANTEKGGILNPPTGCCIPAPQVLEFDSSGALLAHWGGPGQGFDWPQTTGGMAVGSKNNVWITAAGASQPIPPAANRLQGEAPPQDAQVIEFSGSGQFVRQIGHAGKVGDGQDLLNRPAAVAIDSASNEMYVADSGNRRIIVFDAGSGTFKRQWGAYGNQPEEADPTNPAKYDPGKYDPSAPPAKQFREISCVKLAKDGLVYVCDHQSDRLQVFHKDGKFVKEAFVSKSTLGDGSVWDIAFSNDPKQQFLYVADGQDKKVWIMRRDTLDVVTSFGDGGRLAGHFYGVGSVAVDSKGNVYTGETYEGKRVQKFVYQGLSDSK